MKKTTLIYAVLCIIFFCNTMHGGSKKPSKMNNLAKHRKQAIDLEFRRHRIILQQIARQERTTQTINTIPSSIIHTATNPETPLQNSNPDRPDILINATQGLPLNTISNLPEDNEENYLPPNTAINFSELNSLLG